MFTSTITGYRDLATKAGFSIPENQVEAFEKFVELVVNRCALEASMFSINENSIHPDIPYGKMSESAKSVCHTTCQQVSDKIFEKFGIDRWERYDGDSK